jgi:hypothetical protein
LSKPPIQAGFDYVQTLLELRVRFTYDEIAHRCGWESGASISKILKGAIPAHPQGEALYILYFETTGRKPKI